MVCNRISRNKAETHSVFYFLFLFFFKAVGYRSQMVNEGLVLDLKVLQALDLLTGPLQNHGASGGGLESRRDSVTILRMCAKRQQI